MRSPPDKTEAALELATELAAQLADEIAEMQRHAAVARAHLAAIMGGAPDPLPLPPAPTTETIQ